MFFDQVCVCVCVRIHKQVFFVNYAYDIHPVKNHGIPSVIFEAGQECLIRTKLYNLTKKKDTKEGK